MGQVGDGKRVVTTGLMLGAFYSDEYFSFKSKENIGVLGDLTRICGHSPKRGSGVQIVPDGELPQALWRCQR